MKKSKLILAALLLSAISGYAQERILDRIIAIVDDNIILQSEMDQNAMNFAMQMGVQPRLGSKEFDELRKQTLEQLVLQKVLLVKAKEDSVVVDETRIDRALDDQMNNIIQRLGSEEKVEEYFGSTLRKVRRTMRKNLEEQMLVQTLQQQKVFQIPINRREVLAFYEDKKDSIPEKQGAVNLSHILKSVKASPAARELAYAKIQEAKAELDRGVDFAEVAKKYSDDGSAAIGGDLGMMQRTDLVPEYADPAYDLQPGEISDIVESPFGFHIIQLIEKDDDEINTRHVLAKLETTEDDAQKTIAFMDSLGAVIDNGSIAFEDAAKQFSDDETTKEAGGELGTFQIGELQLPEWQQAAQALRVGEMSRPIKTRFGYIIVKLNSREDSRRLTIEDDWEEIEQIALSYKREREFLKWVEGLKKDVYIKINI